VVSASDAQERYIGALSAMEERVKVFKYDELQQADAIRLLTLHSGSPGTELRCSLTCTTLAKCRYDIHGRYIALSYVWGDPDDRTILINNLPFLITANLASALDGLRDESRSIRIWADAICINKSNIPERNQQVSLMREVYSIAQQTIIYLGEADEQCEETFRNLGARGSPDNTEKVTVSKSARTLAVDHILSRPWFSRVWIYQELVLSREVWVQMGRERVTWDEFCDGLLGGHDDLQSANNSQVTQISQKRTHKPWKILSDMRESRHMYMLSLLNHTELPSLLNILTARRGLGVTDLRDMVYGHLAVTGCFDQSDKRCEDSGVLSVDYNKTMFQVFIDATSHILASLQGRCVLLEAELLDQKHREGLPSWVPDWSLENRNHEHTGPIPARSLPPGFTVSWDHNREHFFEKCFCLPESGIFAFSSPKITTIQATSDVVISPGCVQRWSSFDCIDALLKMGFWRLEPEAITEQLRLFCEMYQEWRQLLGKDILSPLPDDTSGLRTHPAFDAFHRAIWKVKQRLDKLDVYDYEDGSLLDILMRYSVMSYSVNIDSHSILVGRKVAILPGEGRAIVPAETTPGDVIHTLVLEGDERDEREVQFIVLRPLTSQDGWETEDKIILEKISHGGRLQSSVGGWNHSWDHSSNTVKHFRFIGTAWIDSESMQTSRLPYVVALH
jgi:hypothetical protein